MNNLFKILAEQRALLTQFGYDARSLHFKGADHNFMDRLQSILSEKIHWSQHINVARDFRMDIAGLFNGDKDLVHYTLHYHFEPDCQTLTLKKVTGRLNDIRLDFPVQAGTQGIRSKDIYKLLARERFEHPVQANSQATKWRQKL
jgi:hypothetical protein